MSQDKVLYWQPEADSVVAMHPSLVYGENSHLVQSYTSNVGIGLPRPNIALFDFKFGLPLLLFIFLFVFVVLFRKSFSKLVVSFVSFKKFWSYQRAQIWGELPFFVLLFIFSVFPISLLCTEIVRSLFSVFSEDPFGLTFLQMSVVVSAIMLLRLVCYRIVGFVSKEKQLFNDLVYTQLIFFAVVSLTNVPVFFVKDFLEKGIAESLLFPLLIFSLAIFCLYFFRTVRLFLHVKSSFLFWILYFCTMEILPLVVIFKFLEDV
jgi:hypothetical protein